MNINFDSLIKTHPKLSPLEINESVSLFCKSNMVFGGSFAILSKRFKRPFLLFSKDLKDAYNLDPEIDFYQYLNTPYDSLFQRDSSDKYFIDFLFYIFRMDDKPEYVKRLNEDNENQFEFPFQTKLRQENKILHCSTGEILFFLLSWRLVIKKILKDISDDDVLEYFNSNSSSLPNEKKFYEISKKNIFEPNDLIEDSIKRNLNAINHLKDDKYLKDLGLTESLIFQQDLRHYLNYIDFKSEVSKDGVFLNKLLEFFKIDSSSSNYLFLLLEKIHLNARFPILPYYYIYKFDSQNRRKDHFVSPVWWTYSDATKYESQKEGDEIKEVLHSLYTLDPLPDKNEWYTTDGSPTSDFSTSFKDYLFKFNVFFSNFVNPIIDSEYYSKQRDLDVLGLKRNSIKSSLAAVMARTQSHNTGSHVLSRISSPSDLNLDNIVRSFDKAQFVYTLDKTISKYSVDKWSDYYNEVLKKQINKYTTNTDYIAHWNKLASPLNDENITNEILPLKAIDLLAKQQVSNERIAIFNSYIKVRQELMAEIVTTQPSFFNTVNFKAEVLDYFCSNSILLDRISGIDNFKYTIRFENKIYEKDGQDIQVAIANGELGKQALYIMIENLIRNTAKHATKLKKDNKLPEQIVFTIRLRESSLNPDFYQITIFDNVRVTEENITTLDECSDEDFRKYYKDHCDGKTCNVFKLKKLIIEQNRLINKKILTDENELRTDALGLIEMEACASYLRGLELTEMDEDYFELKFTNKDRVHLKKDIKTGKEQLRILRAVNPLNLKGIEIAKNVTNPLISNLDNYEYRENCLGYQFYLPKPKELLVVLPKKININSITNAGHYGITLVKFLELDCIYPETNLLSFVDIPKDIKSSFLPKRRLVLSHNSNSLKEAFLNKLLKSEKEDDFNEFKNRVLAQIVVQKCVNKKVLPVFRGLVTGNGTGTDDGNILNNKFKFKNISLSEIPMYYDDHGTNFALNEQGYNITIQTNREKTFFNKIKNKQTKEGNKISNINFRLNYLDSALNNVILLDERIQEQAYKRYSLLKNEFRTKGISYRELWYNQGCYIPTKEDINLSTSNFSGHHAKLETVFKNLIEGKMYLEEDKERELISLLDEPKRMNNQFELPKTIYKGIDTVVVHIGVIEKMLEANGKNKDDPSHLKEILDCFKTWSHNESLDIILTSGRAPKRVDPNYGFAGISVIMPQVIDQRFKHNLHQLILNIRPKNN